MVNTKKEFKNKNVYFLLSCQDASGNEVEYKWQESSKANEEVAKRCAALAKMLNS